MTAPAMVCDLCGQPLSQEWDGCWVAFDVIDVSVESDGSWSGEDGRTCGAPDVEGMCEPHHPIPAEVAAA